MEYVEQRNSGYYVAGTRVSLDLVVYAFLRGESADEIADSYKSITLEQAYGAIAWYLGHRETVDEYLRQGEIEFDRLRDESRRKHPAFYAKLDAARREAERRP